ncbi:hypothetical protein AD867_25900 (plasmid) [Shigella flexneri 2a]|nr:hypothetical protein AD867_25900 [Shigella flexneri 2a]
MKICLYHTLNPDTIPGYKNLHRLLPPITLFRLMFVKLTPIFYRARLSIRDRLLFSLYRYHGETICLVLEYIRNHAYNTSRFLRRNVVIDEGRLQQQPVPDPVDIAT